MTRALFFSSIIAALGGLLFGFDAAVISGTVDALKAEYELASWGLGITVSSALVGTIVGAIMVGLPSDRLGRRWTLMCIALIYLVSAVGSALAWDWTSFLVFRVLGGLGIGGASVVSPMYIAEISPAHLRGRLVAVAQLNIVLGILAAYLSNYMIAALDLGAVEWRWMFGVEAFPALAFFLLLFLTPRSPRWLVACGRDEQARATLRIVGTDTGDVDAELDAIRHSLRDQSKALHEPLLQKRFVKPILLVVAIAMFNQLSGINAVILYAPSIFKMASANSDSALMQSVVIGLMNLVFTIAAMAVIDQLGRRKLMLIGSIGYVLSLGTIAACFYTFGNDFSTAGGYILLAALLVFIASHAFGQGAVIWVFIGEIFPNSVRARGQSLGSFTHWVMAAIMSAMFPVVAELSAGHVFLFFAVVMLGQLAWVLLLMPETRGIPLEEIEQRLYPGNETSWQEKETNR